MLPILVPPAAGLFLILFFKIKKKFFILISRKIEKYVYSWVVIQFTCLVAPTIGGNMTLWWLICDVSIRMPRTSAFNTLFAKCVSNYSTCNLSILSTHGSQLTHIVFFFRSAFDTVTNKFSARWVFHPKCRSPEFVPCLLQILQTCLNMVRGNSKKNFFLDSYVF